MARLDDSEATLWAMTGQLMQMREAALRLQQVVAVLIRRQSGVLVIDPDEVAALPPRTVVVATGRPDGCTVLRVESGEQPEPGHAG